MHWYAYVIPGPGQGAAQPCPSLIEAIDVDTEEMLGIVREGKGEKCIGFAAWGVIIGTYHMIGKNPSLISRLPSNKMAEDHSGLLQENTCYHLIIIGAMRLLRSEHGHCCGLLRDNSRDLLHSRIFLWMLAQSSIVAGIFYPH
jgi:hypothetical protein